MHWRLLKWVFPSVHRRNEGVLCGRNSSNSFSLIFFETLQVFCSQDVHVVNFSKKVIEYDQEIRCACRQLFKKSN